VGGAPLADALRLIEPQRSVEDLREQVERDVRFANITIIEGNDASQFGIGVMCARITEAILRDERAVLPVAAYRERYEVTIGLPTVVGRHGAAALLEPSMSEQERRSFDRSVGTLRDSVRSIGAQSG
jgi:L-lactate dehydrogenase